MGTAGPYDLSAAGRYWFWDAAYRDAKGQGRVLLHQLQAVADEGRHSGYFMGERYDMDHVFYVDGKNAHGATQYYEYPNVYAWVLIHDYLGVAPSTDTDVQIAPRLQSHGVVELEAPLYALRYRCMDHAFSLINLATTTRSFHVDLTSLYPSVQRFLVQGVPGTEHTGSVSTITLAANQTVSWTVE